jgi:hypothetical protein
MASGSGCVIFNSNTSYAVGGFLPAAAWYFFIHVFGFPLVERKTKHQRRSSTALPKAASGRNAGHRVSCDSKSYAVVGLGEAKPLRDPQFTAAPGGFAAGGSGKETVSGGMKLLQTSQQTPAA